MGQQQLLLLVLSTVIVGLATVAGIQAFDENQSQASQDALVQKATSVATDLKSVTDKPTQLGGVAVGDIGTENSPSVSDVAKQIGLSGQTFSAPGAGTDAQCKLTTNSSGSSNTLRVSCASKDATNDVRTTFDPGGDPEISTSTGDYSNTITPANTEGGNTEGGNTEGGNTEGGNTEGGNTEGGNTDG